MRYKTPAEKKAQRRKLVKPLLDDFYNFIEGIAYPIHKLKDAVKNALKLKARVYQIFKIGELPLSNNSVEQSIDRRPSFAKPACLRNLQPVRKPMRSSIRSFRRPNSIIWMSSNI
ncbi:IS66 family transposase [Limosilactobacillus allomucosae]|uniref:Transposase n=1 Tax=Limosilactobacillus allomucosae TaxID=3142938 RepID=A0ABV0I7I1_9LACO